MPATAPAQEPGNDAAEIVYVVTDVYSFFLKTSIVGVYRDEISALRAAHEAALPQGVMRRTVQEFKVQP